MKAWLQRVREASVTVEGACLSKIGRGYLVLLGVAPDDTPEKADYIARRIVELRIFEDDAGKINRSILDVDGRIIVVSQFTLYADTVHGRRPGFSGAARPEIAEPLYERVVRRLREALGAEKVGTGRFGAHMDVRLWNDGPFSIEILA